MDAVVGTCLLLGLSTCCMTARLCQVLKNIRQGRKTPFQNVASFKEIKTMIVAGSGGHTTEMMGLVSVLGPVYRPRHYIVADTDIMSTTKIESMEGCKCPPDHQYLIMYIPRSREVAQSWLTSVFTTLRASLAAFPIVTFNLPDLILVNGPGTCVPICIVGFLLTFLGIHRVRIVYVESICRVQTMSMSGKILYYLVDQLIVQWPQLHKKYPLSQYIGRLV